MTPVLSVLEKVISMSQETSPFSQLGLAPGLVERIHESGITAPTPIQEQSIPVLLEGRDLLGMAQTGTGKTAAFLLPLIQKIVARKEDGHRSKAPAALVLAPTRELAHQVAMSLKTFSQGMGLRYLVVCGGERYDGQINGLKKGVDILVATPGRFEDLQKRGVIDLKNVQHLVLDEADQMIDLGFYPAIRRICNAIAQAHQTIFFSATMPEEMRALSEEFLTDSITVKIKMQNITADTVEQRAMLVADAAKRETLLELVQQTGGEQVLVFVGTKRQADTLSSYLHAMDLRVDVLHGDIRQYIRSKVMRKFKTGKIQVLVATDVAARGIDVHDLNWVINYDLPQMPEVYVHRIGRTGRAQKTGVAISLCSPSQIKRLHAISKHTKGIIDIFDGDGERVTIEDARSSKPGRGAGKGSGRGARKGEGKRFGSRKGEGRPPRGKSGKPFRKTKRQGDARQSPQHGLFEEDTPPPGYGDSAAKTRSRKKRPFNKEQGEKRSAKHGRGKANPSAGYDKKPKKSRPQPEEAFYDRPKSDRPKSDDAGRDRSEKTRPNKARPHKERAGKARPGEARRRRPRAAKPARSRR